MAALQSCIAAGAVVRTPGVDWQRADLEVRDAILHLFSAEEGAEGTCASVADRQLRGNMVPSPPLAKESQEECVNCKALAEQLAVEREKNKNLEAELAGLRRPATRTIDQVVASSSADCDVGDDAHMPGQPAEKKYPNDGPRSAAESLRLARKMPIFAECGLSWGTKVLVEFDFDPYSCYAQWKLLFLIRDVCPRESDHVGGQGNIPWDPLSGNSQRTAPPFHGPRGMTLQRISIQRLQHELAS